MRSYFSPERKRSLRSKQDWTPGQFVKVGFLTLQVVERVPTPGDGRPDYYVLWHPLKGTRYTFTPLLPHHERERR